MPCSICKFEIQQQIYIWSIINKLRSLRLPLGHDKPKIHGRLKRRDCIVNVGRQLGPTKRALLCASWVWRERSRANEPTIYYRLLPRFSRKKCPMQFQIDNSQHGCCSYYGSCWFPVLTWNLSWGDKKGKIWLKTIKYPLVYVLYSTPLSKTPAEWGQVFQSTIECRWRHLMSWVYLHF